MARAMVVRPSGIERRYSRGIAGGFFCARTTVGVRRRLSPSATLLPACAPSIMSYSAWASRDASRGRLSFERRPDIPRALACAIFLRGLARVHDSPAEMEGSSRVALAVPLCVQRAVSIACLERCRASLLIFPPPSARADVIFSRSGKFGIKGAPRVIAFVDERAIAVVVLLRVLPQPGELLLDVLLLARDCRDLGL